MKQVVLICIVFQIINAFLVQGENCPTIISREGWGARDPEILDYTQFPLPMAIIHHTVMGQCSNKAQCSQQIRTMQDYHMDDLNFGDIGYNFLVGGDGNVYEGRGWHIQGAHLIGYNTKSIGVAFIGNFKNALPTNAAIKAAKQLLACGVTLGELTTNYKLYAAKQLAATESPGAKLYVRMRNWPHFSEEF